MQNPLFTHQADLDRALFFAIARDDFQTSTKLVEAGANPNAIFPLEKTTNISSLSLFLSKASQIGKSKGPTNAQYIICAKLLKLMSKRCSFQCKCLKQHKCPLYITLQGFQIAQEGDILQMKCDLIRTLIQNGASIKFDKQQNKKALKTPGKWALKWFDIDGIRSYLITKNCNYLETKIEA